MIEEIVQKQLDFYNNHDLEGFVSTYDDNIEIYNLDDNSIMIKGKVKNAVAVYKIENNLIKRVWFVFDIN